MTQHTEDTVTPSTDRASPSRDGRHTSAMRARSLARALATRARAVSSSARDARKQTTGIVGLDVLEEGKAAYESICERVLKEVATGIPSDAGYRRVVEEMYTERLKRARGGASVEEVERAIGEGQIEELYEIAKDELALIPKMREWKPWEFEHEIEVIEHPKENPYKEELAKED